MTTDPYGDPTYRPGGQSDATVGATADVPLAGATVTGGGSKSDGTGTGDTSTTDTAKAEAGQVKDTAADAAQQVAGTAKEEAGNVAGEAKAQAANLLDQVKGEAGSQLGSQKDRLAGLAHSYAKELGSMASGAQESGPVTDLVSDLSRRVGGAGHWLEDHEPADVLDEVRRFARRRPGAFLLAALAAGVVVGRVTRGAVDEHRAESGSGSSGTSELGTGGGYAAQSGPAYEPAPVYDPASTYQPAPTYGESATGYAETPAETYGSQPTTTGYGTQPVSGFGERMVDEDVSTQPYGGDGSTYGTGRGGVA